MTAGMLIRYLFGDREAILRLAASRWSLVVGAVLVLTASLARNYDGKYLPREGEALLHGYAVSIVNAFLLFGIFWLLAAGNRGAVPHFFRGYLAFLGLFWLTSPMAWLYAIPFERMTSAIEAVNLNLWLLALVSAWRVGLMTRVMSVLWRAKPSACFFIIVLYSDALIFGAASLMRAPLVDFMGGLQHAPEDAALAGARFSTIVLSVLVSPVLIIAALVAVVKIAPMWQLPLAESEDRPRPSLVALCIAAAVAWVPLLAWAQPEQRHRVKAEELARSGQLGAAFDYMSEQTRKAFPPIWDPPPRTSYDERTPGMREIRDALRTHSPESWVSELYFRKHWKMAVIEFSHFGRGDVDFVLSSLKYHDSLDPDVRAAFEFHIERDRSMSEADRASLRRELDRIAPGDESIFFDEP